MAQSMTTARAVLAGTLSSFLCLYGSLHLLGFLTATHTMIDEDPMLALRDGCDSTGEQANPPIANSPHRRIDHPSKPSRQRGLPELEWTGIQTLHVLGKSPLKHQQEEDGKCVTYVQSGLVVFCCSCPP